MKHKSQLTVTFALLGLFFFLDPVGAFPQDIPQELPVAANETTDDHAPILIDEFGSLPDCDFSGRLDAFFYELSKKPDHQGYVINYIGVDVLPADREQFGSERRVMNQLNFRNFDRSRITLVRGGYRESTATTLWLVPPGATPPEPSNTVKPPALPKNKTYLFGKRYMSWVEYEPLRDEYLLPSVRAREKAEAEAYEAEMAAEREAESTEVEADEVDVEVAEEMGDGAQIEEVEEEQLSDDERFEMLFGWVDVGIADELSKQKDDGGLLIFYVDDQIFDVAKIKTLVHQARYMLASNAGIRSSRIRIEFGGYRHQPEVEFWIVAKNGKKPTPTPDERPVEEPETVEDVVVDR